jgi:hypothetical protein
MEKMLDKFPYPMRGIFGMKVYRKGMLIETYRDENLIVNGARVQAAHLVAGDVTGRSIAKIAFGTSGTTPTDADASITNQYAKLVSGFEYPATGQVQVNWELLVTENNGQAIMEFGLLTTDGTLFARKTRNNPIFKEPDISIEGHWTIIF